MSEYVIMPKADYTAACNAIRTKTGKADLIKSGDMEGEILGITSGGGSSADVRYVTFMNEDGTVELGKKAVAVGDDCADPIARGVFSTPTKESTAQYTYTFYGWATTPNGAADSNWNKAVTEDRTVYANFASAVRYYTITYYDSDGTTVLNTQSVAYGSIPTYTPVKAGYTFDGWTTPVSAVTENTSYISKWIEKVNFATLTWAQIASYCEKGQADVFEIGATKTFTMKQYSDGVSYPNTTVTAQIVGINHDDLADGSGKAGITIRFKNFFYSTSTWNSGGTTAQKQKMWGDSAIRKTLQEVHTYTTYSFPTDLYNVMKSVKKTYYNHVTQTYDISEDKMFLPSASELGFSLYEEEGECYQMFSDNKDSSSSYDDIKLVSAKVSNYVTYSTRTKTGSTTAKIYAVSNTGTLTTADQGATTAYYNFAYACI